MVARIVDTETTGHYEEQEKPEVIELAYGEVFLDGLHLSGELFERRYKPTRNKITYGAMSVHHILPEDLERCEQTSAEACLPTDTAYLIGHNIDFDWKALGSPDVKRICTLAMARRHWEDERSHNLGACVYRIMPLQEARKILKGSHHALVDLWNCHAVFRFLVMNTPGLLLSWEGIWNYSEECRLPRKWTFGKYEGKPIGQENGGFPDFGYHGWCLRQPDMDEYLKKALVRFRETR